MPLGLTVLIRLSGNCGQNNRRITFLTPASGFYLEGHVFSNHSVDLNLDCQDQCALARECVSYNIGPMINNKVACELSNSDHLQHPEDLKPRKDWFYRGTEVWLNNTTYQCQLLNPTLRLQYHYVVKICFIFFFIKPHLCKVTGSTGDACNIGSVTLAVIPTCKWLLLMQKQLWFVRYQQFSRWICPRKIYIDTWNKTIAKWRRAYWRIVNSDNKLRWSDDDFPTHFLSNQNLCATNPCLNNGTCYMGYTEKKYACVCPAYLRGENCEGN